MRCLLVGCPVRGVWIVSVCAVFIGVVSCTWCVDSICLCGVYWCGVLYVVCG